MSSKIYKAHPQLQRILRGEKPGTYYRHIHTYAKKYHSTHRGEFKQRVIELQQQWEKIHERYLCILSGHMETLYPRNKKTINACVSMFPVYPRNISKWSYNVGLAGSHSMIPVSMHEILHFVYFKKWMEVFPETRRRELDHPHLVWKVSEILAPIIINNNKEIQRLHRHKQGHYPEFQSLKIGKKSLVKIFEDRYKKHLRGSESFEEYLRSTWKIAQKYKAALEKA